MDTLLLDLDRTLVDLQSFTDYDAAWAEVRTMVDPALAHAGPETTWSSATRACMGVIAALTDGDAWQAVSDVIERHERAAVARSVAMPHLAEFLAATGDRPRGVVTLLPEAVARDALAAHAVDIDVVVGRDPRIRPKPSGDGVRAALVRLGTSARGTVMIGDSTWDAAAAHDAGVRFIGVNARPDEFRAVEPPVPVGKNLLDLIELLRAVA